MSQVEFRWAEEKDAALILDFIRELAAYEKLSDQVVAVDLRRSELSLQEWVESCKPDAVVVAYSMQMLRDDAYEFQ